MIPTWTIPAVFAVLAAGYVITRAVRGRRADREWAAGIAARVRDRAYLDFLEEQFASDEEAA